MNGDLIITLEPHELTLACLVGVLRQAYAGAAGLEHDPPVADKDGGFVRHIIGAAAELAVAKFLNRYWRAGVGAPGGMDVGDDIDVKYSDCDKGGILVPKRQARPDTRYVRVRGEIPTFEILGWIWGEKLMKPEWLRNFGRGDVYLAPDWALSKTFRRGGAAYDFGCETQSGRDTAGA